MEEEQHTDDLQGRRSVTDLPDQQGLQSGRPDRPAERQQDDSGQGHLLPQDVVALSLRLTRGHQARGGSPESAQ